MTAPPHDHMARAIHYWQTMAEISVFFEEARHPHISAHLRAAQKEIETLWTEYKG